VIVEPLALPLTGGNNRPIYDANRRLISITEHAEEFMHAMNNHGAMVAALKLIIPFLRESREPHSGLMYGHAAAAYVNAAGVEAMAATYPQESKL
jgi:hypothetical protein